jgi:hypothetical protein
MAPVSRFAVPREEAQSPRPREGGEEPARTPIPRGVRFRTIYCELNSVAYTPGCENLPREVVMGNYDPQTVSGLACAVDDICRALQSAGAPLEAEMKQAIAKRVLELFENGVTDLDELRLAIMADGLWASSRYSQPEPISGQH